MKDSLSTKIQEIEKGNSKTKQSKPSKKAEPSKTSKKVEEQKPSKKVEPSKSSKHSVAVIAISIITGVMVAVALYALVKLVFGF